MPVETARPRIQPRRPSFDFASVPRHWFANHPILTQVANGVNILFPGGERFFVRSVRHFADRIEDPALREQVRAFYAQEGRHSHAHEAQFDALEAQGYRIRRFLEIYEKIAFEWIEPNTSPEFRLAVTAALEHFTAIMAHNGLTDRFMDLAHPVMRELLYWHAAEEIEHKAVAFDVLQAVNPSYALRIEGLALAVVSLAAFWAAATSMLIAQDLMQSREVPERLPRRVTRRKISRDVFLRGIREYVRRDFHPLDRDDLYLAHDYLASVGLLDPRPTSASAA